jgi:hypothetical protein
MYAVLYTPGIGLTGLGVVLGHRRGAVGHRPPRRGRQPTGRGPWAARGGCLKGFRPSVSGAPLRSRQSTTAQGGATSGASPRRERSVPRSRGVGPRRR